MTRYFKSDNTAPVAPEILAALAEANGGYARGYGDDVWSHRLQDRFAALFETDVRVYAVATGTAANALALACLAPPWGAVFAHHEGHIVRDECGAPEFMSGGARVVSLAGEDGRLTAATLEAALAAKPATVHTLQPAAVSVSQATELGTCYRAASLRAIANCAHDRGLRVHMDGARFANAVAFLDVSAADITWRCGVDVLSLGATKNGALGAEAVVFFDPHLARDFELRRKRAGHLLSKMRFTSAQLLAYVKDGLWLQLARRANRLAQTIGAAAGTRLLHPVEANEVFVLLGAARAAELRGRSDDPFEFYDWGASGAVRFVVSWDQPDDDVSALCEALAGQA